MKTRQQVLYLWMGEGALDTPVVGWAFHDGTRGGASGLPDVEPPYATGVAALEDGWLLLQSPLLHPIPRGSEHDVSYLPNEFVFERRFDVEPG